LEENRTQFPRADASRTDRVVTPDEFAELAWRPMPVPFSWAAKAPDTTATAV